MFLNPEYLWLLVVPIGLAIYQLRAPSEMARRRKLITVSLRLLAMAALVLALAQPIHRITRTSDTAIAVVDCSASMRPEDLKSASSGLRSLVQQAGRENVRLILFNSSPREVEIEDHILAPNGMDKYLTNEAGSNIEAALEFGASLCAENSGATLHLFSDGRENQGDMLSAADRIGRRKFKLVVHEIGATAESSPLILGVQSASSAGIGESTPLSTKIEALTPCDVEIRVVDEKGVAVGSRRESLQAGVQYVEVFVRPNNAGWQTYRISLDGSTQSVEAGLYVTNMVVGIVESAPNAPTADALRSLLEANAKVMPLTLADLNGDAWDELDVLVLADTPAAEIPEATQKRLRTWVEQGGGLLVTGGRNAFGPGGYARSQFADALPLRFPQQKEVRDPSTALAILIDTSVSMRASGVNLAKEIARLALKRLKPHDKAGIVEFYGTKRWAAPMQSAGNHIGLQRALNRLSAGGGTQLLPGLTEAYYGLVNVNTRTKHILLLTDGGVERGAYGPLINRMVEDGIQLSTVTVGPRASSTFLAHLARQGRGQFYTAPNRFKLPEVIVKQPSSSLLNPFVEKSVRLKSVSTSRLVQNLDFETVPSIKGYVRTTSKETAEVLLRSELGDPVLARWNYGLGRVAALTTQIGGEWGSDLAGWDAMPNLLADMTRQLRGVSPKETLEMKLHTHSFGLAVDLRALSASPSLTMKGLTVDVLDSSGNTVSVKAVMPVQGRSWKAYFSDLSAGHYTVNVKNYSGDTLLATGATVIPMPNEFTRISPDRERLDNAVRITSERAGQGNAARQIEWRELWPVCVVLSLLSFLLMILARRLPPLGTVKRPSAVTSLIVIVVIGLNSIIADAYAAEPRELSASEKETIDKILQMEPELAQQSIKETCKGFTERYGELSKLCDYLAAGKKTPVSDQVLALVALEDGNVVLAQKTLETRIAQNPDDLWALTQLARIQDMNGRSSDALKLLSQCLALTKDPETRVALFVRRLQLSYSENQIDAARADIHEILRQPGINQSGVRNYCARLAGLWGDFVTVEELFEPAGEGRKLMKDLLYFGQILLQRGNVQKANAVFAMALTEAKTENDRRYVLDRLVTASREAGTLDELMDGWRSDTDLQPEQLAIMVGVLSGEMNQVKEVLPVLDRTDLPEKTQTFIESTEFQNRILMELLAAGYSELVHSKFNALISKQPRNYFLHESYARLLLTEGKRKEAVEFFQKAIASEQQVGGLMRLARSARGLSLHQLAIAAAEKAASADESAYVQAKLFVAEQLRLMGKTEDGLKILQKVETETANDPGMVVFLAEAYEGIGRSKDAIRLYRTAYEKSGDEELLKKLLAIDDVNRLPDKGFALWRELWENASEPMTVVQAQDRMLALGAETGVLADIAIEFEERLDEGELSERELTMLLEIYSSANDPVSAADILVELARKNDAGIVETYRKMVRVYMECELFGRCNTILRKLIQRDPENRDDYLRSLALIALERQSSGDAAAVLGELADRSVNGVLNDSFSAGVLSMIGRRQEAVRAYRRALAANPEEAETWLLWANAENALGKAGKKRAIGRLSLLMEESGDNDLFTIAVDGLLNVGASRAVFNAALRRVYERLASQPHTRFLYQLAADLNEELGQQQQAGRILEQSLAITDEGREITLRELMAIGNSRNSVDDVVRHARSLLNTAKGVPPDECLELGSILLGKGYISEADNAFLRITMEGDTRNIARDIVQRYESAGYYKKAAKLIRDLVLGSPHDMDLILRKAIIEEKLGNYDIAQRTYLDGFDQLLDRIQRVRKNKSTYVSSGGTDHLNAVVAGLTLTARSADSRKSILGEVRNRFYEELRTLDKEKVFGESIQDNPRLDKLHDVTRRMAVIFHERDCLESIDSEIAERYAKSPRTIPRLASWRRSWGLWTLSDNISSSQNGKTKSSDSLSANLHDPAKLNEALAGRRLEPSSTESLLSISARLGCDDALGTMLTKADLRSIPKLDGTLLSSVGLAHGDAEFQRKVLFETLSPKRTAYRGPVENMLGKQIPIVWHLLSPTERQSVTNQFELKVRKRSQWHNPEGRILYLKCLAGNSSSVNFSSLCKEAGKSTGVDIMTLNRYFKAQRLNGTVNPDAWAALKQGWLDKPETERIKALKQLVSGLEPGARECVLAQFALLLDDETISNDLQKEFSKLFQGSHVSVMSEETRHMARPVFLALSGYNENRLTEFIYKNMAKTVKGETVFDFLSDGQSDANDRDLALRYCKAIDVQKAKLEVDPRTLYRLHSFVLQPLANALSKEQLDILLSRYKDSEDPFDALIRFLLLRHAGRDEEALGLLNQMRSLRAEDSRAVLVREVLPAILVSYGWDAYAPKFMHDGSDPHLSGLLMPYRLYDPLALAANPGSGLVGSDEQRILAGELLREPAMVRDAGRRYLTDTRHPASGKIRTISPRIAVPYGGLRGFEGRPAGNVLEALTDSTSGVWEAYNWLSTHYPREGSSTVRATLQNGLAKGIAKHGMPRELRDELEIAASQSMLNNVDVSVVRAIAMHDPAQLPKSVAKEMPTIILHGAGPELGRFCKVAGMEQFGLSLTRWALATDIVNKGTSPWLPQYLELLPESERLKRMQALLPLMGYNGIRHKLGGDEAVLFETLLRLGMNSELGQLLDRYLDLLKQPTADVKLQDSVANALARIDRLDDYRRVVRRRIFVDQFRKRNAYCASPISLDADDYTGLLPEPDQVPAIDRCIEIHLETYTWLRKHGVISREVHLAQICILGRWCADRGLNKQVDDLLSRAEELSVGMLTGRLWLADLYRQRGNEAPAIVIERELLGRELLPVARIPEVLKAVASEEGQGRADAIAFQASAYSNHPDLLPLALRHAQFAGLKKEATELAIRIQKLSRLVIKQPASKSKEAKEE